LCAKTIAKSLPANRDTMQEQYEWITDFWNYYDESRITIDGEAIDFNDMIKKPLVDFDKLDPNFAQYDYIIVDEYQDISKQRFDLVRDLSEATDAKIIAVGDDWQSIYHFSGCDLNVFLNFNSYFNNMDSTLIT
jgi:DNA helicase-4